MKKLLIWIVIVSSLILSFNSCDSTPTVLKNTKEEGDFVYNVLEHEDGTKYAVLLDFSEAGKEKEVIFVPEYIGGYIVEDFNLPRGLTYFGKMESANLKRIYFKYEMNICDHFLNCPNLEKQLVFFDHANNFGLEVRFPNIDNSSYKSKIANVTFYSNDEIYWIDDYDYGTAITVQPPEPTKEGYKFAGWYKESDCINKWEFETDTLPKEIRDEDNWVTYQETKLYAKWELDE